MVDDRQLHANALACFKITAGWTGYPSNESRDGPESLFNEAYSFLQQLTAAYMFTYSFKATEPSKCETVRNPCHLCSVQQRSAEKAISGRT